MIGTRQTEPFYLESPSGEFFTSPFLLAFASVPSKLPPPGKSLIGEKSPSGHLIGARWYDPELAMWMSPDPASEFANPYSYVGGDVMNRVDPDGRFSASSFWKDVRSTAVSLATNNAAAGYIWRKGEEFAGSKGYEADDWQYYAYTLGAYETITVSAAASTYVGLATGCATCALATGSSLTSLGFYGMNDGKSAISTNVGVGTIQWTGTDHFGWNNPFDDDPWYENVGDAFGWIGVASDATALHTAYFGDNQSADLYTEHGPAYEGSGKDGSHTSLQWKDGGQNGQISHGPEGGGATATNTRPGTFWDPQNSFDPAKNKVMSIRRISTDRMNLYSPPSTYQAVTNNCSTAAADALRQGGVWWAYSPMMTPNLLYNMMQLREAWLGFYGL